MINLKQKYIDACTRKENDSILDLILKSHLLEKNRDVSEYHEFLLYVLAHPHNKTIEKKALKALSLFSLRKNISGHSDLFEKAQNSSGIINSFTLSTYSLSLTMALIHQFPNHISLYDIQCPSLTFISILKKINAPLPDKTNSIQEFKNYCTKNNLEKLTLITTWFDRSEMSIKTKELLFEKLRIYIVFHHDRKSFSRTLLRGLAIQSRSIGPEKFIQDYYFNKKSNEVEAKKLRINLSQKENIQRISAQMLMMLKRETDPITHANVHETEWYDMGRGLQIALFYLKPEFRFKLDAYVGYMAFRNSIPYAYGGAWVLGSSAAFGLNLFESFRKSEANWTFVQICGLYKNIFKLKAIRIEPYQIGKDNEDGIQSGAFWFYYKHGFRPKQKKYCDLAYAEFLKINERKSYRTSYTTLKELANSDLIFSDNKEAKVYLEEDIVKKNQKYFYLNGNIKTNQVALSIANSQNNLNSLETKFLSKQISFLLLTLKEPKDEKQKKWILNLAMEKSFGDENKFCLLFRKYIDQYGG
ncbi:MAG TPA: hypothetical protein PKH65_04685 [Bacteroidia bacterium]|nr:hypothetical protein [Bacteroidia bacterium]HNT79957.1 hypothetical protein [Bacteroidia bacterium]